MDILIILMAGACATLTMIAVMYLIHLMKWANADMIRAVGSIVTQSYDYAFITGLMIHFSSGLFFSLVYAKLVGFAPVITVASVIVLTTFVGLVHGLIVGLFLTVLVAEHHPLPEFQKAGFPVIVAHIVGHIAYGFTLGIIFALNLPRVKSVIKLDLSRRSITDFMNFSWMWILFLVFAVCFCVYLLVNTLGSKKTRQ